MPGEGLLNHLRRAIDKDGAPLDFFPANRRDAEAAVRVASRQRRLLVDAADLALSAHAPPTRTTASARGCGDGRAALARRVPTGCRRPTDPAGA